MAVLLLAEVSNGKLNAATATALRASTADEVWKLVPPL